MSGLDFLSPAAREELELFIEQRVEALLRRRRPERRFVVPVSQMGHLSDQDKMHLAVGVNVRRRHLDADRRRDLVHRLRDERGLSVREIAAVTGWSKSTIGRDLSPPVPADAESAESVMARWERQHPEPLPEHYSDENHHLAEARYHLAAIDHLRDRAIFAYEQFIKAAGELAADPVGAMYVAVAASGIRFYTAERKAEAWGATPDDQAAAERAWVAFVAARDVVRAHDGEPFGNDRTVELQDFLYHPAFKEWRDEADADVPDGTG